MKFVWFHLVAALASLAIVKSDDNSLSNHQLEKVCFVSDPHSFKVSLIIKFDHVNENIKGIANNLAKARLLPLKSHRSLYYFNPILFVPSSNFYYIKHI